MKRVVLFMTLCFCLSCSEDVYNELFTNDIVPDEPAVPVIESFKESNTLILNWEMDEGADEYIVYRSLFPDVGYSKIVTTASCFYKDKDIDDGLFYYYKIAKKRGKKEFSKSKLSFGVATSFVQDVFEDNDTKKRAKNITELNTIPVNIYFARDVNNISDIYELIDIDWYYIDIFPKRKYQYKIVFDMKEDDASYNNIIYVYYNNTYQALSKDSNFEIPNYSNEIYRVYIKIEPNRECILANPTAEGVRFESYYLKLINITPTDGQT